MTFNNIIANPLSIKNVTISSIISGFSNYITYKAYRLMINNICTSTLYFDIIGPLEDIIIYYNNRSWKYRAYPIDLIYTGNIYTNSIDSNSESTIFCNCQENNNTNCFSTIYSIFSSSIIGSDNTLKSYLKSYDSESIYQDPLNYYSYIVLFIKPNSNNNIKNTLDVIVIYILPENKIYGFPCSLNKNSLKWIFQVEEISNNIIGIPSNKILIPGIYNKIVQNFLVNLLSDKPSNIYKFALLVIANMFQDDLDKPIYSLLLDTCNLIPCIPIKLLTKHKGTYTI